MTCRRWPPLTPEAYADIERRRKAGETWLMLSQVYGINAEALKRRVEVHRVRAIVQKVEQYG